MRSARLVGALTVVAAVLLSACTSSASKGRGTSADTPTVSVDGLPSDTSVGTDTSTPTDSGTPTTTTSSSPGSAAVTLPKDTCTAAQLTVRVMHGGAVPGQEIALITFTNSSAKTCSMFGYPGVSLRLTGKQLAQPALRSPVTAHTVHLLPGERAEAQITDFSSCQASLSDTLRVYPPNLTTFVEKPFELRACRFEVDPVSHSS